MQMILRMRILALLLAVMLLIIAGIMAFVRIDEKVDCAGAIEPAELVLVRAKDSRIVRSVEVDEGEDVAAGQALAKLDSRDIENALARQEENIGVLQSERRVAAAALEEAEATPYQQRLEIARLELQRAEEDHNMAQVARERIEELYKSDFASKGELDDAEAQERIAAFDLEAAKQRLKMVEGEPEEKRINQAKGKVEHVDTQIAAAEKERERLTAQLQESVVTAPVAGRVIKVYVKDGEQAKPGGEIFALSAGEGLVARVRIPEASIGKLALGQRARVSTPAFPHRIYGYARGELIRIDESGTRGQSAAYFEGIIRLDEVPFALKPGSSVSAEIITGSVSPYELMLGKARR